MRFTTAATTRLTEREFHVEESESFLGCATKYALEGNREKMDIAIAMAQEHAEKARIPSSEIDSRVEAIHNSVGDKELDFHLRECKSHLGCAVKYALEGNREKMDIAIAMAQKHAEKARIPSSEIDPRVAAIRNSLGNEHDFHFREMEHSLDWASKWAFRGDREMMDFDIATAKEHAEKARIPSSRIDSRVEAIRNSFVADDH